MPRESPYMTVREVAEYTQLSERTIHNAKADQRLVAIQVESGCAVRFHIDDVHDFMRSMRTSKHDIDVPPPAKTRQAARYRKIPRVF